VFIHPEYPPVYEHLMWGGICMNSGGRLSRMPNQPATTIRGIRVPDALWEESKVVAKAEGFKGVSEMVRDCLERRVAEYHAGLESSDET
jgi:hypothetical protein